MSFDKPQVLMGFLAFIPLIILGVYHYRKHRPFMIFLFSSIPSERDSLLRELRVRYFFSSVLFWIFLACVITALAGPRWGRRMVMDYHRGVDVVLALDLSRSMEVRDIMNGASRLDRGIRIALDMAEASGGIRFGAAIGKGKGVLAVPLTYDIETVVSFLEGLSSSVITGRGTNLETLINAASEAFQNSFPTQRMIILFSDGESWSGSLAGALDRFIQAEITITAVGMGTEIGGEVPQDAPVDEEGNTPAPISYRRSDVLQTMAERTGGVYVDGNREDAADMLTAHIRSFSPASGVKGSHIEAQAQWRLFVMIALLSLGGSKLLEKRLRKHD
jgi:Ca-activated chloride channel family protein